MVVRVASSRARLRDAIWGQGLSVSGVVEDSSYRLPFVAYHNLRDFSPNSILMIQNAYVHEYTDGGFVIVADYESGVKFLGDQDPSVYVWHPNIGQLKRPSGRLNVSLSARISEILPGSGPVHRCSSCGVVLLGFSEPCRKCGGQEYFTSLRIRARMEDQTGSIQAIFPHSAACDLLGITEGRFLYEIELAHRLPEHGSSNHPHSLERLHNHKQFFSRIDPARDLVGSWIRVHCRIVRVLGQLYLLVTRLDDGPG